MVAACRKTSFAIIRSLIFRLSAKAPIHCCSICIGSRDHNCTPSFTCTILHTCPSRARSWDLARCGHHDLSDGRSARHHGHADPLAPCRFCAVSIDTLAHALPTATELSRIMFFWIPPHSTLGGKHPGCHITARLIGDHETRFVAEIEFTAVYMERRFLCIVECLMRTWGTAGFDLPLMRCR